MAYDKTNKGQRKGSGGLPEKKHVVYTDYLRLEHKRYPEKLMNANVERRSKLSDIRRVSSAGRKT